jgi:hypothetical protein
VYIDDIVSLPDPYEITTSNVVDLTGNQILYTTALSGSDFATQTTSISASGTVYEQTSFDDVSIASQSPDPVDITVNSSDALVIEIPSSTPADDVIFQGASDGSDDVIVGAGSSAEQVAELAPGGLAGDTIDVSDPSTGGVGITIDIGADDTVVLESDSSDASVSQDFEFGDPDDILEIDNPSSFYGTILNFLPGDTLDLGGIENATSATLGAGNVLTVFDSAVVVAALQLDPSQSFSGTTFDVSGTDVTEALAATGFGTVTQTVTYVGEDSSGANVTYSAEASLTPTDIQFPAYRTDQSLPSPALVIATFITGDLVPGYDSISIVGNNDNTSPFYLLDGLGLQLGESGTLDVGVSESTQPGVYSDQTLPLELTYLGEVDVDLTASVKVYAPAIPKLSFNGASTNILDFGIVHVGETATIDVDVSNVATGDLTDVLSSSPGQLGDFTAENGISDIAAGSSGSINVSVTGEASGDIIIPDSRPLFGLVSQDPDLPDEGFGFNSVPELSAEVYNYANPVFVDIYAGQGDDTATLIQYGNDWTLDLGTFTPATFTIYTPSIEIENATPPVSFSDSLEGSVDISASPDGGFNDSDVSSEGEAPPELSLLLGDFAPDTSALGAHTEAIVFHPLSVDPSGTTVLADMTLTVTDDIVLPDIPNATVTAEDSTITVAVRAGQEAVLDPLFADGKIGSLDIEGPGTVEIDGAAPVFALEVEPGATLAVQGATITGYPVIDAGGYLSGFGTAGRGADLDGTITASGGTLELTDGVNGAGTLSFTLGASLLLDGTVDATESLVFNGPAETLLLNTGADVLAPISGFQAGDAIGPETGQVASATYDTTDHTLTVVAADPATYTLTFIGDYQQSDFVVSDGEVEMACFQAGTRILTERGEVPAEELVVGDLVHANGAGLTPITWIGYRQIDCSRHPRPDHVWPVCVRAHGFAAGRPHRDLWLSPDHAVFVDGMLIPVRQLINGTTIVQVPAGQVTYFHVELARHDVLTAEGLPVESYLDTGNRAAFANAGASMMLHPDFGVPAAGFKCRDRDACAPFAMQADQVEPVWRRLAARAAELGYAPPVVSITTDAELRLEAGGRVLWPLPGRDGSQVFAVPPGTDAVRLVSRAAAPSASRPWLEDRRRLGVSVGRIKARCGTMLAEVPVDHPALRQGWHDVERAGARMWRWTDGNSYLPIPPGTTTLEIVLAGLAEYPAAESASFSTRGTVARCSDHSGR